MFGSNNNQGLPGSNQAAVGSNEVLERLAEDYMKDRKWKRYIKLGFLGLFLLYILSVIALAGRSGGASVNASKPHTAVVKLDGVIGGDGGVFANQINKSLQKAFESKLSKAVLLHLNSPGGSPVQSAEINEEILRLRSQYPDKPFYAVMSDVCASGCYYVAVAAEDIYANKSSIVGSIGVRMDSFGFVETLEKLGVERRSITAGKNKAILDPFLPVVPSQQAHARKMLAVVHQQFIDTVQDGRGERLSEDPDIFTGLFWSGETAKKLGLIDDFGSVDYIAREIVEQDTLVDYSYRPSFIEEFSNNLGISISQGVTSAFSNKLQLQ